MIRADQRQRTPGSAAGQGSGRGDVVLQCNVVVLDKQGTGEVLKHGQRDRQAHPPGGQLERVIHMRPQGHDGRDAGQLGDNLDAAGMIKAASWCCKAARASPVPAMRQGMTWPDGYSKVARHLPIWSFLPIALQMKTAWWWANRDLAIKALVGAASLH